MVNLSALDSHQNFKNTDIKKYKNLAYRFFTLNSLLFSATQSYLISHDFSKEHTLQSIKDLYSFTSSGEKYFEDFIYDNNRFHSRLLDIDHSKITSVAKNFRFIFSRKQSSDYQSLVTILTEEGLEQFINRLNSFVLYQKNQFSLFYLPMFEFQSDFSIFKSFFNEVSSELIKSPPFFSFYNNQSTASSCGNDNFDNVVTLFSINNEQDILTTLSSNQFKNSSFNSLYQYIQQIFKFVFNENTFLDKTSYLQSSAGQNFGARLFPLLTTLSSRPEEKSLLHSQYQYHLNSHQHYSDFSTLPILHFIKNSVLHLFNITNHSLNLSTDHEIDQYLSPKHIHIFSQLLMKFFKHHNLPLNIVKENLIHNLSNISYHSKADDVTQELNSILKTSSIEENINQIILKKEKTINIPKKKI